MFCGLVSTALLVPGATIAKEAKSGPTLADLEASERIVFSQFGEDGVIEKIFETIEPGPKFAVEFGAHDGVQNSNMRNLVLNHGWSTYQIEGSKPLAEKLAKAYAGHPTTKTEQAWIWPGNIEVLF
ncbi:MAG: hypothetical protein GY910_07535, partial [bacterium]|nr:hypothetical protein [bacterium]